LEVLQNKPWRWKLQSGTETPFLKQEKSTFKHQDSGFWGLPQGGQSIHLIHSNAHRRLPDRTGYRPVIKAALLGVHRGDAARCWVSFTPPLASRSMFGVLG
jgi:hypothetical protein